MHSGSRINASAETLQTIFDAAPNPLFLIDREHRLVLVNDAMCRLAGRSREEVLGQASDWLPAEQKAVFWAVDDQVFATGEPNQNEEVASDGRGDLRVILTRKCLIHLRTEHGDEPFILASISDITEVRQAERRARYLAYHDPLTGLANRAQFNERLEEALAAARTNASPLALLALDLDGFKGVNDRHGHPVGDELLRVVAKRLASLVRSVDTVARLGGDELCIIQTETEQPGSAQALAARILSSISHPVVVGGLQLSISVSIGSAVYPEDGESAEELTTHADEALYTAKKRGRGTYVHFNRGLPEDEAPRWDIETDLRAALETDQLSLAFQPLVTAADGELCGYEALACWQHPERGAIPPEDFIPAAESAGLIGALGARVLRQACEAAAGWPERLKVCVNVSSGQLDDENLPAVVERALASSGLPGARLELEIKETALLSDSVAVTRILNGLKALGVGLTLDNFGAGNSLLATLQHVPFDRIKIDRSFIADLSTDARSVALVRAVLGLARTMGVAVSAEGVEKREQFVALQRMGCRELQGFYIGRAAPLAGAPVLARRAEPEDG